MKSLVPLFFLFIFSTYLHAAIIETDDFSPIMSEADSQTLVLFNISNTIYASSNTMGDALWKNYFAKRVHTLFPDQKAATKLVNEIKNKIVKSVPKKLVDEKIRDVITHLQNNHIPVLGLTLKHLSRPYADNFGQITSQHLLSLGIDFEKTNSYLSVNPNGDDDCQKYAYGIIFTEGLPTGKAIEHFLKRTEHSFTKMMIVDDRGRNLEEAEQALAQTGIAFTGFRSNQRDYRFERFDPTLGIIEFLKFLSTNEIISDEEAASIKKLTPFVNYEALLNDTIISLVNSKT